ncbi:hypothetical protein NQ314_001118 [Rhamnusium bicolor]|uniref:Chitin-binding type-2 domain-containing protein n=1 Tax=Rhamnusium bicolor TaxID=1586634 RepID=A0AAV8ZVS1_9CUCU|nr:hypothetical protein NQ314_001118 [Rhamnusium bicolor]
MNFITDALDPLCPYPSDDLTFFPDPNDCSQYYQCYQGNKQLMRCPANFFWNFDYGYCDYLQNVDCTKNNDPTAVPKTTTTTTTTTTPRPTTSGTTTRTPPPTPPTPPPSPTTPTPGFPQCSIDENDGHFFVDPEDCSRYYECNKGETIRGQCPPGTLWSEELLTCDFAEHVICKN